MDVVTLEKYDAIYEIYSNIRVYYVHVIPIDNWIFLPKPTPTNHSSHLKAPLIWWEFGGKRARAPHTLDRGTKAPLSNGIDILKCGQWFKWWNWCGKVFLHFPWTLVELAIHLWHGIIWKDGQQQKLQRVPWMWNPNVHIKIYSYRIFMDIDRCSSRKKCRFCCNHILQMIEPAVQLRRHFLVLYFLSFYMDMSLVSSVRGPGSANTMGHCENVLAKANEPFDHLGMVTHWSASLSESYWCLLQWKTPEQQEMNTFHECLNSYICTSLSEIQTWKWLTVASSLWVHKQSNIKHL